ncbi:alpha/beta hydrolase [Agarivorans sp. Alg241-V36]|uniref:alpha/beta hydrolase n=1 Tax=Agarivorans sp. Alg241-V36 TaxID=2305992 RepID=UPI0013D67A29|nr:alpha/beta hydrolase [Agarivorans sp. Alg241-V36]
MKNILNKPFTIFFLFLVMSLIIMIVVNALKVEDEKLNDSYKVEIRDKDTLIVLLHAYNLDSKSLDDVRKTIESTDAFKGADFLIPDLPFDKFSMADSSKVTLDILQAIDIAWSNRKKINRPYQRIIFVGHSIGALYARKVYVVASGENADTKFEKHLRELSLTHEYSVTEARPWVNRVDRIILLAGMNRGWTISHHMSISRAISMQAGVFLGYILEWVYDRPPIIFTIRRGSPFITQLRLQWLSMKNHTEDKGVGNAVTVQMLGTIDDLVSPEDNIDLITGADFSYLEVPVSGHKNVIEMDDSDFGKKRQEVLRKALFIEGNSKPKSADEEKVTDMIFVIHGIRDEGYWTSKIAQRVRLLAKSGKYHIETETSSYGYFSMLSFLMPGARQEKVQWFMDKYTEAKAKYPDANFHFIGHSHGTYLLAKAIEDYDSVKFKNVFFAGSVVHQDYQWTKYIPDRIEHVYNFEATADWVVAFFPKALQSIGIQNLGSAGHDGFKDSEVLVKNVRNHTYITGGHSAAIQEAMWDSIAQFVLTGDFVIPPETIVSSNQNKFVSWPAKIAPMLWVAGIALLLWILYFLFKLNVREWKKTLIITAYLFVIWIILTEV